MSTFGFTSVNVCLLPCCYWYALCVAHLNPLTVNQDYAGDNNEDQAAADDDEDNDGDIDGQETGFGAPPHADAQGSQASQPGTSSCQISVGNSVPFVCTQVHYCTPLWSNNWPLCPVTAWE